MQLPNWILPVSTVVLWGPLNLFAQPAPDSDWQANANLKEAQVHSVTNLGAIQGVTRHDDKFYLYGDVYSANPRVGIIREYDGNLQPTGVVITLTKNGQPLSTHPTGLTWHPRWGTFLGNTVNQKATILHIDWDRALADGNLDHALLDKFTDDAAINGCRPEFVEVDRKVYLATADYGEVRPTIRLLDPAKLFQYRRTSAPGVVVHRILAGPFNQTLAWDGDSGQLTCIQNVVAGRGWQLDVLDLRRAVEDGRASGPGVRVRKLTFFPHSELEGYCPLDKDRGLFVTAYPKANLVLGRIQPLDMPVISPRGTERFVPNGR